MSRVFSFLAGGLSGALVGAVAVLLLTPASGEQLRDDAKVRWETAVAEAKRARNEKQAEMEAQFSELKGG